MMGIREWMNERPRIATGIVGSVVAIAIGAVIYQVLASRRHFPSGSPAYYFSVDDGKTFFAASSDNIPPFDYNGQKAVHAYVFECDGKQFVGYLERFTPEAHDAIVSGKPMNDFLRFGRELKRPGDSVWTKSGNLATESKLTNITCPDGHGIPEMIEP